MRHTHAHASFGSARAACGCIAAGLPCASLVPLRIAQARGPLIPGIPRHLFHGVHLALERMSRVINDIRSAWTPGVGMVPSCGQGHEKSPHSSRCDVSHGSNPDSPPVSSVAPVSAGALCMPLLNELCDVLAMLLQRHLQLSLNLWARRVGGRAGPAGSAAANAIDPWEHRHCREQHRHVSVYSQQHDS